MKKTPYVVIVLLALLLAQPALAAGALDTSVERFHTAAQAFGNNIQGFGVRLLFILAGIQLTYAASMALMKGAELLELLFLPVRTMITAGFFFFIMKSGSSILPTIIESFDLVGQKGSGLGPLTPSDVFTQGIDVAVALVSAFDANSPSGLLSILDNLVPGFICALTVIFVVIAFAILAAQMALALISGYLWAAITPFLMGFGGLSFTRDMALSALKGGIPIGMKILCVYFVASVATTFAPEIGKDLGQITVTTAIPTMLVVLCMSVMVGLLAFQLPKIAADLLNGTASLSAGDAAAPAAMAAGIGAGAVAGGVAGAGAFKSALSGQGNDSITTALTSGRVAGASMPDSSSIDNPAAVPSVPPPASLRSIAGSSWESRPIPGPDTYGDASGASIGGADAGTKSSVASAAKNVASTARTVGGDARRTVAELMPNDSHTVGVNANIGSHHEV